MRKTIQIGQWHTIVSDRKEEFSTGARRQSVAILDQWKHEFPREKSWVQNEFGVPSLIVRLDCVVHDDRVSLFEVEERPAGIGVTSQVNPVFSVRIAEAKKKWPKFNSLVSPLRKASDDPLWLDSVSLDDAMKDETLLLIRAEPEEQEYHQLLSRSVSTLMGKGDKSYGVGMRLWKKVSPADFNDFPWEIGFCLKPLQGSKCRNVEIWHPMGNKTGIGGISTRTRIRTTLESHGHMYLQEFISPMIHPTDNCLKVIYRVFFAYSPDDRAYSVFLGGLWNARPNLKIHGASDTIMGPIE
jgi:hypothetical protein